MVETVVSMARSMVRGAISVAASAAAAEVGLLVGVQKDIWFIKDELETIQAFLEIAETIKKKDVLLKVWAKQVRDLSYNIEDCLSEFMVHVESQFFLRRLMKLKDRHRIAMRIRDLKTRVEEVSIRNTRYNLIKTEASNTIDSADSYTEDIRNLSASNIDEADLVGFSKPKGELIELMDVNTKDGFAKVAFVVGMGGLGKTTLARKIFESKEDIVNNFSYRAWITVSQTFSKIEMLKDMIMQLFGNEELKKRLKQLEGKTVQVDDLATYLRKKLEDKRVANLGMLQAEVDAHPNNPMLQLKQDCSQHDLGDVFQGFDVVETEECSSQATNLSQDHDIGDDDFLSCISDEKDTS
uniref:Uncharacterized protein n=1 Tax=Hordeum vulgare subsp. vulgare TaxID=112509 RepID=A0A8I6YA46_HORVV